MPLLRPRDFDELLARTGLALQRDADRTSLGPHGALDGKGRPVILYFTPMPGGPQATIERFSRIANLARRIGAEVAEPEVAHKLSEWLVFVERASGEELCLADWLLLRPSATRRRLVAERLRAAVAALHAHRTAHGNLTAKHVLIGGGGEVVLTGLSLRALDPEADSALATHADGQALGELLRALLGAEASEWTGGGFLAPALAVTGTLTVETPIPTAAGSSRELGAATDNGSPLAEMPAFPPVEAAPNARRTKPTSTPPRRRAWPRPAYLAAAAGAVGALVAVVSALQVRSAERHTKMPPPTEAHAAFASEPVQAATISPRSGDPGRAQPPSSTLERKDADAAVGDAAPMATGGRAPQAATPPRPRAPRPRANDLLEDELPTR